MIGTRRLFGMSHKGTKDTKARWGESRSHVTPGCVVEGMNDYSNPVIGAAIEVHRRLGPGLLETIYHQALAIELRHRGIPFRSKPRFPITYRDEPLRGWLVPDFVVDDSLVVEIKAVRQLAEVHLAQVLSYLHATDLRLALLLNFSVPVLREGIRRVSL